MGVAESSIVKGKTRLFQYPPSEREAVVRILCRILEAERDVMFAYLHGSFAGEGPFRDVDVAVHLRWVGNPNT